jgi:chromosome segregation ATPase
LIMQSSQERKLTGQYVKPGLDKWTRPDSNSKERSPYEITSIQSTHDQVGLLRNIHNYHDTVKGKLLRVQTSLNNPNFTRTEGYQTINSTINEADRMYLELTYRLSRLFNKRQAGQLAAKELLQPFEQTVMNIRTQLALPKTSSEKKSYAFEAMRPSYDALMQDKLRRVLRLISFTDYDRLMKLDPTALETEIRRYLSSGSATRQRETSNENSQSIFPARSISQERSKSPQNPEKEKGEGFKIKSLESEINDYKVLVETLKAKIQSSDKESLKKIKDLTEQLESATSSANSGLAERKNFEEKLRKATTELNEAKSKHSQIKSTLEEELTLKTKQFEKRIKEIEEKYMKKLSETEDQLQSLKRNQAAEIQLQKEAQGKSKEEQDNMLKQKEKESREKVELVTKERDSLKRTLESAQRKVEGLEQDYVLCTKKIEEYKTSLDKIIKERDTIQNSFDELSSQNQSLQKEKEKAKKDFEQVKKESELVKQQNATAITTIQDQATSVLNEEKKKLTAKIESLTKERDTAMKELDSYMGRLEQLKQDSSKSSQIQSKDYEKKIDQLNREFTAKLNDAQRDKENIATKLSQVEGDHKVLLTKLESSERELGNFKAAEKEQKAEIVKVSAMIKSLKKIEEQLNIDLAKLKKQNETSEAERERVYKELTKTNGSLEVKVLEVEDLKKQLALKQAQVDKINENFNSTQTSMKDTHNKLTIAESEKQSLTQKLADLTHDYTNIKTERDSLKKTIDEVLASSKNSQQSTSKEVEIMKSRISLLEQEKSNYSNEITELRRKIEIVTTEKANTTRELQEKIIEKEKRFEIERDSLKSDIDKLTRDLASSKEDGAEILKKVDALSAKLVVQTTELESLTADHEFAETLSSKLSINVEQLEQDVKTKEEQIQELQSKIKQLQSNIDSESQGASALKMAQRESQQKIETYVTQLGAINQLRDKDLQRIQELEKTVAEGRDKQSNTKEKDSKEYDELVEQNKTLRTDINELKTQKSNIEAENKTLELKLQGLETSLKESQLLLTQKASVLSDSQNSTPTKGKSKDDNPGSDRSSKKIASLEQEIEKHLSEKESLNFSLQGIRGQLDEARSENKLLQKSQSEAEAKIKQLEQKMKELDKTQELKNLTAEHKQTLDSLKSSEEGAQKLFKQIEKLESENKSLQLNINLNETRNKQSIEDSKERDRAIQDLDKKLSEATTKLLAATEEVTKKTSYTKELEAKYSTLESNSRKTEDELSTVSKQLKSLQEAMKTFESSEKSLKAEKKTLEDKIITLESECKKAESELKAAATKLQSIEAKMADSTKENDGLSKKIKEFENQVRELQGVEKQLRAENQRLGDSVNSSKEEVKVAEDRADKYQGEINQLKKTLDAEVKKFAELNSKLQAFEKEKLETETKAQSVAKDLKTLQEEKYSLGEKLRAAEEKIQLVEDDKKQLSDKITSLNTQLSKSEENIKKLTAQIESSQKDSESAKDKQARELLEKMRNDAQEELKSQIEENNKIKISLQNSTLDLSKREQELQKLKQDFENTTKLTKEKLGKLENKLNQKEQDLIARSEKITLQEKELSDAIDKIESKRESLNKLIEQHNKERDTSQSEIKKLRGDLDNQKAEIEKSIKDLSSREEQYHIKISSTSQQNCGHEELILSLQSQIEELKAKQSQPAESLNYSNSNFNPSAPVVFKSLEPEQPTTDQPLVSPQDNLLSAKIQMVQADSVEFDSEEVSSKKGEDEKANVGAVSGQPTAKEIEALRKANAEYIKLQGKYALEQENHEKKVAELQEQTKHVKDELARLTADKSSYQNIISQLGREKKELKEKLINFIQSAESKVRESKTAQAVDQHLHNLGTYLEKKTKERGSPIKESQNFSQIDDAVFVESGVILPQDDQIEYNRPKERELFKVTQGRDNQVESGEMEMINQTKICRLGQQQELSQGIEDMEKIPERVLYTQGRDNQVESGEMEMINQTKICRLGQQQELSQGIEDMEKIPERVLYTQGRDNQVESGEMEMINQTKICRLGQQQELSQGIEDMEKIPERVLYTQGRDNQVESGEMEMINQTKICRLGQQQELSQGIEDMEKIPERVLYTQGRENQVESGGEMEMINQTKICRLGQQQELSQGIEDMEKIPERVLYTQKGDNKYAKSDSGKKDYTPIVPTISISPEQKPKNSGRGKQSAKYLDPLQSPEAVKPDNRVKVDSGRSKESGSKTSSKGFVSGRDKKKPREYDNDFDDDVFYTPKILPDSPIKPVNKIDDNSQGKSIHQSLIENTAGKSNPYKLNNENLFTPQPLNRESAENSTNQKAKNSGNNSGAKISQSEIIPIVAPPDKKKSVDSWFESDEERGKMKVDHGKHLTTSQTAHKNLPQKPTKPEDSNSREVQASPLTSPDTTHHKSRPKQDSQGYRHSNTGKFDNRREVNSEQFKYGDAPDYFIVKKSGEAAETSQGKGSSPAGKIKKEQKRKNYDDEEDEYVPKESGIVESGSQVQKNIAVSQVFEASSQNIQKEKDVGRNASEKKGEIAGSQGGKGRDKKTDKRDRSSPLMNTQNQFEDAKTSIIEPQFFNSQVDQSRTVSQNNPSKDNNNSGIKSDVKNSNQTKSALLSDYLDLEEFEKQQESNDGWMVVGGQRWKTEEDEHGEYQRGSAKAREFGSVSNQFAESPQGSPSKNKKKKKKKNKQTGTVDGSESVSKAGEADDIHSNFEGSQMEGSSVMSRKAVVNTIENFNTSKDKNSENLEQSVTPLDTPRGIEKKKPKKPKQLNTEPNEGKLENLSAVDVEYRGSLPSEPSEMQKSVPGLTASFLYTDLDYNMQDEGSDREQEQFIYPGDVAATSNSSPSTEKKKRKKTKKEKEEEEKEQQRRFVSSMQQK